MSDKTVRIRRASHDAENRYFMMLRATAQHRALTYEARGVLAYLLSKPVDWIVQVKDLQQEGCGRDKVYRILRELETFRYLTRELIRANGVVKGIEYVVYESPFTEKPDTAEPDTANTEHTYKREEQNTETTTDGDGRPLAYSLYEQNIGLLTPLIADQLKDLTNDYGIEWLREAMVIAVQSEKRSLKYVAGILKNWKRDGKGANGKGTSVHDDPLLGGLNFVS